MNTLNHTPRITIISNDHVLVTNAHGTYPVHRGWLDIPASIVRWKAAGAFTGPAFTPSALRTGERAA